MWKPNGNEFGVYGFYWTSTPFATCTFYSKYSNSLVEFSEEFIQINIMIHILRFGYWNNNKTEKKISECEAAAAANQNQKLYLLEKKIIIKIYAGMCLFTILKRLALTKLSANQIEHDHSRDATHCFISIVYNEI